jgi:hypothetical protein
MSYGTMVPKVHSNCLDYVRNLFLGWIIQKQLVLGNQSFLDISCEVTQKYLHYMSEADKHCGNAAIIQEELTKHFFVRKQAELMARASSTQHRDQTNCHKEESSSDFTRWPTCDQAETYSTFADAEQALGPSVVVKRKDTGNWAVIPDNYAGFTAFCFALIFRASLVVRDYTPVPCIFPLDHDRKSERLFCVRKSTVSFSLVTCGPPSEV